MSARAHCTSQCGRAEDGGGDEDEEVSVGGGERVLVVGGEIGRERVQARLINKQTNKQDKRLKKEIWANNVADIARY